MRHDIPTMPAVGEPISAARRAELLFDELPEAGSIDAEAIELVASVRRLVEAVVMTDVSSATRRQAIEQLDAVTAVLEEVQRPEHLYLVRHADGRIESLTQPAAGRLNPQALPIEWVHRPTEPPPGTPPTPVEITARCTFTVAHGGSPGRVHGGLLALALDEVTGIAIRCAGATGMTVHFEMDLKGAVPLGRAVDIAARYTGGEGRKAYATGEITVDGAMAATATVIYVAERR